MRPKFGLSVPCAPMVASAVSVTLLMAEPLTLVPVFLIAPNPSAPVPAMLKLSPLLVVVKPAKSNPPPAVMLMPELLPSAPALACLIVPPEMLTGPK